jgi:hypothetical protein
MLLQDDKGDNFLPPELVLVMAHAASFLVLNSPLPRMSIRTGKTLASMTAWIWARFPAVMLEIVLKHNELDQILYTYICIEFSQDYRKLIYMYQVYVAD